MPDPAAQPAPLPRLVHAGCRQWKPLAAGRARHWQAQTVDADDQAQAQPDWALHYQQLSGGAFSGRVLHIELPGLRLVREDSNRALHQQGTLARGSFGLALPLAQSGAARFSGQPVTADAIMVGRGDELDLVTPQQFSLIAVVVDEALLQPLWQHMYQKPTAAWLNQQRVLPARAAAAQAVRQLHLQFMQHLEGLAAEGQPQPSEKALLQWRDAVLMEWIEALPESVSGDSRPAFHSRRQLVQRALDLLHGHAEEPLSILQLCQALGTSRRQLNYSFQDVLCTSPLKYGTALRLARVRRELKGGNTTVAQAASRFGFWHLGQLARDYRLHYGELPSQTLRTTGGGP